ncbi:MAG: TolC family protein [Cyclobacteriaceae bacterium]|nr:TolC family protein [Cyclobacteriaceae bacterium]
MYQLQSRPELFSYGLASWEDAYIPFSNNFNYNIGAGIRYSLPYWGGSSFKVKMLQSNLRVEQMTEEKDQAFQEIKKEIETTLNDIDDRKNEVANDEKIIMLANETLSNAWIKYQAGQGTIVDVLDAESILTGATIGYSKSMIAYLQSLARLNYLSGNNTYPF